ncbi:MAG: PsbP-related protein [Crocinitomicaceae bacterium]
MKKIFFGSITLFIFSLFLSCGGGTEELSLEDDFNVVKVASMYELSVPNYMEQAVDLNEEASLQYQNLTKETYVIVIDEPKGEFEEIFRSLGEWNEELSLIENYRDLQVGYFTESTDMQNKSEPTSLKIDGLPTEMVALEGRPDGMQYDIYYQLGFIEGKENIYMITAWTLLDRKEKYKKTFEMIVKSFKLL